MSRARVLVVDDKENMLKLLERILAESYDVVPVDDGEKALQAVAREPFDLVLTDIRMPGASGFEVLKAVKQHSPSTEVILITAHGSVPRAVEAIKEGAYDYVQKPFDPDELSLVVARALERRRLRDEAARLRRDLQGMVGTENILGKSAAMRSVFALVSRASELDITVLITGETGTGKELVARAIHAGSARRDQPFVAVNCGALPPELIESELFGHAKGAFTGATEARRGLFEEASKGTLFLDEIGELPLNVQVKLNRALQNHEVRRVGETTSRRVDARILAATHRDLRAESTAGRFREDLFYRLNVFPIELPPLRSRREDLPLLATHFLSRYARQYGRPVFELTPAAMRAITSYGWPGNVRELENALERAVAISSGPAILPEELPREILLPETQPLSLSNPEQLRYRDAVELARDAASRQYLASLLRAVGGNVTRAAERAGMERESLHRILKRHGLRSDDFKP